MHAHVQNAGFGEARGEGTRGVGEVVRIPCAYAAGNAKVRIRCMKSWDVLSKFK